jgi:hypothetical protein
MCDNMHLPAVAFEASLLKGLHLVRNGKAPSDGQHHGVVRTITMGRTPPATCPERPIKTTKILDTSTVISNYSETGKRTHHASAVSTKFPVDHSPRLFSQSRETAMDRNTLTLKLQDIYQALDDKVKVGLPSELSEDNARALIETLEAAVTSVLANEPPA